MCRQRFSNYENGADICFRHKPNYLPAFSRGSTAFALFTTEDAEFTEATRIQASGFAACPRLRYIGAHDFFVLFVYGCQSVGSDEPE